MLFRSLFDLIYPPFCFHCSERVERSQLCRHCWEESRLIDPADRCVHCFQLADSSLCHRCRIKPLLPYPRLAVFPKEAPVLRLIEEQSILAIASFAYYQWCQLGKKDPDVIVPVLPSQIATAFADLCQKPCLQLLRRRFSVGRQAAWELRTDLIEEDQVILLFDPGCTSQELTQACATISEAFPKRVYILSLRI